MNLETLYNLAPNEICRNCSILGKPKSQHCISEDLHQSDILFLSDSFKMINGSPSPFRMEEYDIILKTMEKLGFSNLLDKVQFSTSVKCPGVREADIDKDDRNTCRNHLYATIEKVRPKIIFACGNLPLVMLTKKSGIMKKRGSYYPLKLESGFECLVYPIYNPWQVIAEPGNAYLFELDINSAINNVILNKLDNSKFSFSLIDSLEKLSEYEWLKTYTKDISCDIETEGLDFNLDKITTVSISWKNKEIYYSIVLPLYHFENPVPHLVPQFTSFIKVVLSNKRNRKVFHNAKFDMKFLYLIGCEEIENVWDTKFMCHIWDENKPKSLKNLVSYFFPGELPGGNIPIDESEDEEDADS